MAYRAAKIYSDGNHYIAIPEKEKVSSAKKKGNTFYSTEKDEKKKAFEEAYGKSEAKSRKEKSEDVTAKISHLFNTEEEARAFTAANIDRVRKNIISRKTRLARKINLGTWNYFCTFTYDDERHTEDSFKQKLSDCFKKMRYRHNWVYIGVWERSEKNKRLHFHGIFNIPDSGMIGELIECTDFNTKTKKMRTTLQNTYFNERFGRSDFSPISKNGPLGSAAAYIMKYIEKSGERIVYSKGTPTYFVSDILDDDVVCTIGQEDRKLLLFDKFSCFTDGCYIGEVSPEVIAKMPKSN